MMQLQGNSHVHMAYICLMRSDPNITCMLHLLLRLQAVRHGILVHCWHLACQQSCQQQNASSTSNKASQYNRSSSSHSWGLLGVTSCLLGSHSHDTVARSNSSRHRGQCQLVSKSHSQTCQKCNRPQTARCFHIVGLSEFPGGKYSL